MSTTPLSPPVAGLPTSTVLQELSFRATLEESDGRDWITRLVYADWLEDQGRDMEARGQRWQAEHEKRALNGGSGYNYYRQSTQGSAPSNPDIHPDIPDEIFDLLTGVEPSRYPPCIRRYSSAQEADMALAIALNLQELNKSRNDQQIGGG